VGRIAWQRAGEPTALDVITTDSGTISLRTAVDDQRAGEHLRCGPFHRDRKTPSMGRGAIRRDPSERPSGEGGSVADEDSTPCIPNAWTVGIAGIRRRHRQLRFPRPVRNALQGWARRTGVGSRKVLRRASWGPRIFLTDERPSDEETRPR
jgi:hypothetical protein